MSKSKTKEEWCIGTQFTVEAQEVPVHVVIYYGAENLAVEPAVVARRLTALTQMMILGLSLCEESEESEECCGDKSPCERAV
jgi:hypothetical protein